MIGNVRTYFYRVGDVVFLTDRQTTGGGRHPYVILSDISSDTYEVICMGMTSCRNRDTYNVIPIVSPDGKTGYINPNQIFRYTTRDIRHDASFSFSIENEFAKKLQRYYLYKIGMIDDPEIDNEIHSMFVDIIHDGESIKHGAHSIGYRIPGESTPNPINFKRTGTPNKSVYSELDLTKTDNNSGMEDGAIVGDNSISMTNDSTKELVSTTKAVSHNQTNTDKAKAISCKPANHIAEKRTGRSSASTIFSQKEIPNWNDYQLKFVYTILFSPKVKNCGGVKKLSELLNVSLPTIYRRKDIIKNEFMKRNLSELSDIDFNNNPFSNEKTDMNKNTLRDTTKHEEKITIPEKFSSKTKYDPKFWEVGDLLRYESLYNSRSYEIIKSELGYDKAKQISIYSTVQTRLISIKKESLINN